MGGGNEWETGHATQAATRYGCFLPDLTGLARGLSAADLPPHYISPHPRRRKFRQSPPHECVLILFLTATDFGGIIIAIIGNSWWRREV